MREIKFRFWDKENREMIKGSDASFFFISGIGNVSLADYGTKQVLQQTFKYIPMQYTGLKDKKGKEIYEGDIVGMSIHKLLVEFINGTWQLTAYIMQDKELGRYIYSLLYSSLENYDELQVIGNIYQSPELLK